MLQHDPVAQVLAPEAGQLRQRLGREIGHALEIDCNHLVVDVAQGQTQVGRAVRRRCREEVGSSYDLPYSWIL